MQKLIFLTIFIFCIACSGPVKENLPKDSEHPKLIENASDPRFGTVRCSLEDFEGNLWFGTTEKGLYKYDGVSFNQFKVNDGLNCNRIYCILEDKDRRIWVGTEEGLCLFNGKSFEKIDIPLPKNLPPNKNPHYKSHWIYSILQTKSGKIWLATIDGVYIYDGKSFKHFPINEAKNGFLTSNDKVERIFEDNAGNIWLGGRTNEGVFRYDGESIVCFKLEKLIQGQNGPKPKPHSWAWPQMQDKDGNIWFSNWGGAYRYDGKIFTSFSSKEGLPVTMVAKIIEDRSGNIWFSGSGLFRYDGKSIVPFTAKDRKAYLGGWSILEDNVGILWVGTRDKGLYVFDGKEFITYIEFLQLLEKTY